MNATPISLETDETGNLFAPVYKCERRCGNIANWIAAGSHLCTACKEDQERNAALIEQQTR